LKQLGDERVIDFDIVETLRKPSTGLKRLKVGGFVSKLFGRDTQKTQHGIETSSTTSARSAAVAVETLRKPSTGLKHHESGPSQTATECRDTQKTQHRIET